VSKPIQLLHVIPLKTSELEALCKLFTFLDLPESAEDIEHLGDAIEILEGAYYAHVAAEHQAEGAAKADATG